MNEEPQRRTREPWPIIPWRTPLRDRNKVWRVCALCPRTFITTKHDGRYLCQRCQKQIEEAYGEASQ